MGLVMKSSISLTTRLGLSEIQLLYGDLTKLPVEDKVDIVFVSAFPGDYTLVPGTLIYAMCRNLDLHVGHLAKDKACDLLKTFNCWLSKPLPDYMSFRRLVCFERMNRFEKLSEQISGIFRAMMPIFNNEESTVITPLLAAGDQGYSELHVLKAILSAAYHWIKAGLPLKCLKIVIYSGNPHTVSAEFQELLDYFMQMKTKWEEKKNTEVVKVEKTFDVCLSFTGEDVQYAMDIFADLQKVHQGLIVHKEELVYDHEAVWQEKIFNVMVSSRKIIVLLTPNYVGKSECLEQFNLALCCNRLTGSEILAPFYLQTVNTLPSYMTLIQYTECRVRKQGENSDEKLLTACNMLVQQIDRDKVMEGQIVKGSSTPEQRLALKLESMGITPNLTELPSVYDVFISYAHKTPTDAHRLYINLLDTDPDLKVFLDRSELRTGNSWQKALYEAVDKAKIVVAFINDSYMQSTVCQEEYNIALARYMSMDGIYFMAVLTSADTKEIPAMFSATPLVDISRAVYEEDHYCLAEACIKWLEGLRYGKPIPSRFSQVEPRKTRISQVTAKWRERAFDSRFTLSADKGSILLRKPENTIKTDYDTTTAPPQPPETGPSKTVVFSFAQDSFKQAMVLAHLLEEQNKDRITCEFLTSTDNENGVQAPKLQLLDSVDLVVAIVSDDYLDSTQHQQELHIALCRQRMCKDKRVIYLLESHHTKRQPVYAHLLHSTINMGDELWAYLARRMRCGITPVKVRTPDSSNAQMHCSGAEYQALIAAALDIGDKLWNGEQDGGNGMPTNIVNLVTLQEVNQSPVPVSQRVLPVSSVFQDRCSSAAPRKSTSSIRSNKSLPDKPPSNGQENKSSRQVVRSSQSCQVL